MQLQYPIITLTGDSGSGKTTLAKELLTRRPEEYSLLTSTTSRDPRETDILGEYEHLTIDEFERLASEKPFLWSTSFAGNHYGTKREYVDSALANQHRSLMILVPSVVPILRNYAKEDNVLSFFLKTPPVEILRARMRERGDSANTIEKRLVGIGAWEEIARDSNIPYIFVNTIVPIDESIEKILGHL